MSNTELEDLIKLYAARGIKDWNDTDDMVCREVRNCLSTSTIVENEYLVREAIKISKRGSAERSPRFFPVPDTCRRWRGKRSDRPRVSLFAPRYSDGAQSYIAFDLISFVSPEEHRCCLAFRFEPADESRFSHGYSHVQFSRSMLHRAVPIGCVPSWLPDSYPAFPLPARDSTEMFLTMAVAVHGFEGGVKQLIEKMLQDRPLEVRKYVKRAEALLGIHGSTPESSTGTSDSNARSRP